VSELAKAKGYTKIFLRFGKQMLKVIKSPWESTFLNLSRFLEKMENAPYLIGIQNLSINKIDGKDDAKEVKADFLIKVFAK